MEEAYARTGELAQGCSVVLDESVPLASDKVRVTVEPLTVSPETVPPQGIVLESIWARQKARGHVPPTVKEVESRVADERNSWD